MSALDAPIAHRRPFVGRVLIHPVVDVLLVCGGFSIPFLLWSKAFGPSADIGNAAKLIIFIFFNFAHFASSTVRLYTKPGAVAQHRFLAYGLPGVMLAAVAAGLFAPAAFGRNFTALYLTWSPYHYAAQAYGMALIYAHRSGLSPSASEKRWLWWTCMIPFLRAFINPDDSSVTTVMGVAGIHWLLPGDLLTGSHWWLTALRGVVTVAAPVTLILPCLFALRGRLPLLSVLVMLTNALWLVAFSYFEAAVWATVAHSIQYLCIVSLVYAKDARSSTESNRAPPYYIVTFYLLSMLLGGFLFLVLPALIRSAATMGGLEVGYMDCFLMVVVAINLHHFIVDGYIWRSPKPKPSAAT